ncbi:copper amine oxidase N-terminal domain-containing protein [Syntrophothermus lipocalidus]|uniref:Copper amine oxidase domain protein n=1 Tax=Syntrophothermus lipocalidus (strain DSM 12680 / TGB-C1) TaxID=643648 RepID=D7CMJ2_SYNLT|nr:copper amine oxidase N-terminal domain-containing protein [Syntrophothermus lipocalidus]ADI01927.1 copper amine oxidase domain protein [Syntrophothermus lipocalidus DSM 12680]
MGKKWLAVTGAVVLTLALAAGAFAANPIKLIVNGQEIKPDVPPQIVNGRIMVPIRWVVEALGAGVQWEQSSEGNIVKITAEVLQRLRAIEPEQPETIVNELNRERVKQFLEQNQLYSIQDIRSLGRKVPFEIASEDDTWVRPVYSKYWHSTFMGGKYSDVSTLVSCAQRNLFVYTGGLSEGTGLYYSLGFTKEKVGSTFFNSLNSFELWLINRKVKEIYRLGDEWLVVVEPQLQGYQTVKINYDDVGMTIDEATEPSLMLFRVVTPDGYELEQAAQLLPVR